MKTKLNHIIQNYGLFLISAFIFIGFFLTNGDPYIRSDGYGCYHVAKSIVSQGTFAPVERPVYWDYMGHTQQVYEGRHVAVCPPGAAILNVPGLVISSAFNSNETIYNDYFMAYNGHTIADGISVLITASILCFLSFYLMYKTLRELKLSVRYAYFLTVSAFFSTYIFFYSFLNPSFTHIYELFGMNIVAYYFVKYYHNPRFRYIFLTGVGSGLAALSRPSNAFIIFPIVVWLLYHKHFKQLGAFILGGLPSGLIWMTYNYISFGKLFTFSYQTARSETFDFSQSHLPEILFSPIRGWFVYSPVFLVGIIGLILMFKKQRGLSFISLATIIPTVILYSFWPAWWAGGSIGNRFFISLAPLCIIGLVYFAKTNYKKQISILLVILTIWSLSLNALLRFTNAFDLNKGKTFSGPVPIGERYTPQDLYRYHTNLLIDNGPGKTYVKELYKNLAGGSGLMAISLGISDVIIRVDDRGDEIRLVTLKPPIVGQSVPGEIEFIVKTHNSLYLGTIKNYDQNKVYSFSCESSCTGDGIQFDTISKVSELKITKYAGMTLEKQNLEIYFRRTTNLQFKGPEIRYEPGKDINYPLNILENP